MKKILNRNMPSDFVRTGLEGVFLSEGLWILVIRTPPWETICFTQTGQRSGELTANYDQISVQESLDAEVCVSSEFRRR